MPNVCEFVMFAKGAAAALDRLEDSLPGFAIGDVDRNRHVLGTAWDVDVFAGSCAWSVGSSMVEPRGGEALPDVLGDLSLDAEIWGREPNMGFEEHYVIGDGGVAVSDRTACHEVSPEYGDDVGECVGRVAEATGRAPDDVACRWDCDAECFRIGGFGDYGYAVGLHILSHPTAAAR